MAWGTPPSWAAGNVVTAAKLTTISDDLSFLRSPPCCRVYNSATISHTNNGAFQALTFNTERYDTDSMHSTSTFTGRITFTTAGKYAVGACVYFAANATGDRSVELRLNGTTLICEQTVRAVSAVQTTINLTTDYAFAAADYVEVLAYQSSGGNLNMTATLNEAPEFWARWFSA